jgi:hypothetical protein
VRRGLMKWDPRELPLDLFEARIKRLRSELARAGLDGFIIYTNNVRPGAVHHLTGFTPYWSEGLLLVPMRGGLVFATALSNRVAEWVRSTNPVSEVVSTPRPGALIGARLAQGAGAQRIGVLELDAMPWELFADLCAGAPGIEWMDGSAAFAALRCRIDAAEERMLAHADSLARAALAQVQPGHASDARALAGLIEGHARLHGAEEVYIALAPDLAADTRLNRIAQPAMLTNRFAVRASVAYKGSWVRRSRTIAQGDRVARADAWFEELIDGWDAGGPLADQIAARLASLPGAVLQGWMAEGLLGSYPLSLIGSSRTGEEDRGGRGSFFVLTIELELPDGPWIGAAPVLPLTNPPSPARTAS